MADQIRYCTTEDGVQIAYMLQGEGPALLLCPAMVESFTLRHLAPAMTHWHDALASRLMVVRYDMRGTGISQREVDDFSGGAVVRDLEAVVRSAGLERVALCASTLSGPRAITFAARHPDLVSHLILIDTLAHAEDATLKRPAADALVQLALTNWHLAAQTLADMGGRSLIAEEGRRRALSDYSLKAAEAIERSVSPEKFAVMMGAAFESWQALEDLPLVTASTLVIHHDQNFMWPLVAARRITAGIRGARLMTIEGVFVGATNDPDRVDDIIAAIHEFVGVGGSASNRPAVSGTAVILFTDIVESTALTERVGDARFREMSRGLDAGLRAAIRECGGVTVEAKTLGDGVLATFGSAAQAIEGARRCLALSAASELGLHIGVHAGDVIREEGNVFGGAVNIAARICGLSEAGEILVSDVVRGMARSSAGVVFEDRGEREMKGVGEPVRVYAVVGSGS